jgi:hypothetical protein
MRKAQPVVEVLVPIEDILARLAGSTNPFGFQDAAAELAATMPAAVTRDWAGRVALSPVDAERVFLSLARDRAQASSEQAERLAELEAGRPAFLGAGVVGTQDPGDADWRAPQVAVKRVVR